MTKLEEKKRGDYLIKGKNAMDVLRLFGVLIFFCILVLSAVMIGKYNNVYGFSVLIALAFMILFIGWGLAVIIDLIRDIRNKLDRMD